MSGTYNKDVMSMGASYGEDEIVCPWCGYEHTDSWETRADNGDFECHGCGKTFAFTRDVSVTYSTSRNG